MLWVERCDFDKKNFRAKENGGSLIGIFDEGNNCVNSVTVCATLINRVRKKIVQKTSMELIG
jgi:hypothetical protein